MTIIMMRRLNINIVLSILIFAVLIVKQDPCSGADVEEKKGIDGVREDVKEVSEVCANQTLSQDSRDLLDDNEEADNREIRCYWNCVYQEIGISDERGFGENAVMDFYEEHFDGKAAEEMKRVAKICLDESADGKDACEVSGLFAKCMFDKQKEVLL